MTRRTSIVEQVSEYFAKNGTPMTAEEYKNAADAPVRFQLIKRHIGSWSRLLNMIEKLKGVQVTAKAAPAPAPAPAPEPEPAPAPEPEPTPAPAAEKAPVVEKTKGA